MIDLHATGALVVLVKMQIEDLQARGLQLVAARAIGKNEPLTFDPSRRGYCFGDTFARDADGQTAVVVSRAPMSDEDKAASRGF